MLTTNTNQTIGFTASDGTCYVSPGVTQIGNYLLNFRGGNLPFTSMTSFDTTAHTTDNYFQNSALIVFDFNHFPDLTSNYSTPASSEAGLGAFYIADTTTSKALGFFTFQFDGTNINLKSSSKVF